MGTGTSGCSSFLRSRSPAQASDVATTRSTRLKAGRRAPLMARPSSRRAVLCQEPVSPGIAKAPIPRRISPRARPARKGYICGFQTDNYRMCLDYCCRRSILPSPWQSQGLGTQHPRRVGCKLLAGRRSRGECRPLELDGYSPFHSSRPFQ